MLVKFKSLPKNSVERRQILRQVRRLIRKMKINAALCGNKECELYYEKLEFPTDCDEVCERCTHLNQRRVKHVKEDKDHDLTISAIKRLQKDLCDNGDCCLNRITEMEKTEINGVVDPEGIIISCSPEKV